MAHPGCAFDGFEIVCFIPVAAHAVRQRRVDGDVRMSVVNTDASGTPPWLRTNFDGHLARFEVRARHDCRQRIEDAVLRFPRDLRRKRPVAGFDHVAHEPTRDIGRRRPAGLLKHGKHGKRCAAGWKRRSEDPSSPEHHAAAGHARVRSFNGCAVWILFQDVLTQKLDCCQQIDLPHGACPCLSPGRLPEHGRRLGNRRAVVPRLGRAEVHARAVAHHRLAPAERAGAGGTRIASCPIVRSSLMTVSGTRASICTSQPSNEPFVKRPASSAS